MPDPFGFGAHARFRPPRASGAGEAGDVRVHDHRAQRDARAVFDRERGLHQLGDRCLLGHGDEHHLATLRVGEELDDVGRLLADGPDPDRVEEPAGRHEEADRVARSGGVEHDEVGGVGALECLDLPQHEDVLHARHRGGDHVEGAARGEPARDPPHPVVLEVLEQRLVGGEGPRPEAGAQLLLLVGERRTIEARGET